MERSKILRVTFDVLQPNGAFKTFALDLSGDSKWNKLGAIIISDEILKDIIIPGIESSNYNISKEQLLEKWNNVDKDSLHKPRMILLKEKSDDIQTRYNGHHGELTHNPPRGKHIENRAVVVFE